MSVKKNLTFAVGLGTGQCVHVPILNDDCLENKTEAFYVSLRSEVDCVTLEESARSIEVTIFDDDSELEHSKREQNFM